VGWGVRGAVLSNRGLLYRKGVLLVCTVYMYIQKPPYRHGKIEALSYLSS
jgi:hypothetical protein